MKSVSILPTANEGGEDATSESIKQNETRLLALTSLTQHEFKALLSAFGEAWQADGERHPSQKERKRQPGGGRKPTLKRLEDTLLFILLYFKIYPLQEAMGTLFGMSQGQANVWSHRLTPVLHAALGQEHLLPERNPLSLEETLAQCELLECAIDGTERRRQRSTDAAKHQELYSGKKTHTVKKLMIVHMESRQVYYLSQTDSGK